MRRTDLFAAAVFTLITLTACGGGGSPTSAAATVVPDSTALPIDAVSQSGAAANVAAVAVDGGTDGSAFNMPFVTVTVCTPGTSSCQAIDHVLIDTGSYGLRLAAAVLRGPALPAVTAPSGAPLAECAPFASGYAWGSVRQADVKIAGETAAAIPIQFVDDAALPAPPFACAAFGRNIGVGSSTNGIIGIGALVRDCGGACASSALAGLYYACSGATCSASPAPLASQVVNPVAQFATDNNGVIVSLPAVPVTGATGLTGTLTFGIGTRANNQLAGSSTIYPADSQGNLQTTYNGRRYTSFFDTGTNALLFTDSSLPRCAGGFYCPGAPVTLTALVAAAGGTPASLVTFSLASPQSTAGSTAAPVGAPFSRLGRDFDWGLPFFYGRTVAVAISGAATPFGTGPWWSF